MKPIEPEHESNDGNVDLAGIALVDARDGNSVDLGTGPPLAVLSIIRHRH
ncbi:MAG: hypothetical protein M3N37_06165 [Actinomycetota bacterium]|nr:hypothetical protein [Actinomycetota bacterium]